MSLTTTVSTSASTGGLIFSSQNTLTGSGRVNINEDVPGSSADLEIDFGVPNDATQPKFFALEAQTGGFTVELWNASSMIVHASATYTLAAGETFIWPATDGEAAPAWVGEEDIAFLSVTSTDTTAAVIVASCLFDAAS